MPTRFRKYRARFQRMGEAATRQWLVHAQHHLKRQQQHVDAAKSVLADFDRAKPTENTHG